SLPAPLGRMTNPSPQLLLLNRARPFRYIRCAWTKGSKPAVVPPRLEPNWPNGDRPIPYWNPSASRRGVPQPTGPNVLQASQQPTNGITVSLMLPTVQNTLDW